MPGLDLATRMILDMCGGTPSKAKVAGTVPETARSIDFELSRVEKLTGLKIADDEIRRVLETLGFAISGKGKNLKVAVPSWRPDIGGPADLVEEVVRIHGLDMLPSVPLPRPAGVARATLTESQRRVRRARRALAARGLVEAVTWSFLSKAEAEALGGGEASLELSNPISVELAVMRPNLLAGLLAAAQRNRNRGMPDVALFEVGQSYRGASPEDQYLSAAGIRAGTARLSGAGRHWSGAAANVDSLDAKADVAALLSSLGFDATKAQITRNAPSYYHPGRSGTLRLGPKVVLAYFGEVHPATLASLDVSGNIVGFEVFLDALPEKKKASRVRPALEESNLMPLSRDFAFVVDRDVAAGDVVRAAAGAEKALIRDVSVFDLFEGGRLAEEGKKSLAIAVTLQPKDQALTDAEIEAVSQRIIAAVAKATGGEIRG